MQTNPLNLKWDGGTAEGLVKILHKVEEFCSVDLEGLLRGGLLLTVFTGDDNKVLLIRQCVQQASKVLENYETQKFLQKKRNLNEMQEEDLLKEASLLLEAKIKSLNKTLNNKGQIELPMGLDASGKQNFLDFTPVKDRKQTTSTIMVDQSKRETIVRNLQFELDTVDFSAETLAETKLRLTQKKNLKEGKTGSPSSSVSVVSLKDENDRVLTKYFRVLVRQLLQEAVTGKNAGLTFDFQTEVGTSKASTIIDTDGSLERVRRKLYTQLSNSGIGDQKEMLAFIRKMKSELNTYLWLCKIYRSEAEVVELRKDVHEMFAGKLDTVSAEAGLGMHMTGQCDPRVNGSSPSITKYEFYIEYLESTERARGPKVDKEPIAKPIVRLAQPSQSSNEEDHLMTELKSVGEGIDSAFDQMRVLLANGMISKSPNGTAVLEKLTEFQSKMSETLFKKKSEEEGEKKPIKDTEAKKSSEKRKKKKKDSESDSDSEEEKPKPKKGATISKLYSMEEMREIMKIGAEYAKGNQSETATSNKNVCFDFRRGKCDRGSSCRFDHEKEAKGNYRKQPCFQFARGECKKNNCGFSHDQPQAHMKKQNEELLCVTVTKEGFCAEQTCKNMHGKWKEVGSHCRYEKEGKPCPFLLKNKGCNFTHEKMNKNHNNS